MDLSSTREVLTILQQYNERAAKKATTTVEHHMLMQNVALTHMLYVLTEIATKVNSGLTFDANAPTNIYGEGLVEGIQNAIVRGQQGISTHG